MAAIEELTSRINELETKYANLDTAGDIYDPDVIAHDLSSLMAKRSSLQHCWGDSLEQQNFAAALQCLDLHQRLTQLDARIASIVPNLSPLSLPAPDKAAGLAALEQKDWAGSLAQLAGSGVSLNELKTALNGASSKAAPETVVIEQPDPPVMPQIPDDPEPGPSPGGKKLILVGALAALVLGVFLIFAVFPGLLFGGPAEPTPVPSINPDSTPAGEAEPATAMPAAMEPDIPTARPGNAQATALVETTIARMATLEAEPTNPPTPSTTPTQGPLRTTALQGILLAYEYTDRVTTDVNGEVFTRMRAEPLADSDRMDELRNGEIVDILSNEVPGWYQIRIVSTGNTGWIERWLVDNTDVPPPPTATPTPVPTSTPVPDRKLRFRVLNYDDNPYCISIRIDGITPSGWRFIVNGVAVDGRQLVGNFDGAGNARVCGLPTAGQEVTISVLDQNGNGVPGGVGVLARGGVIMVAPWQ